MILSSREGGTNKRMKKIRIEIGILFDMRKHYSKLPFSSGPNIRTYKNISDQTKEHESFFLPSDSVLELART